MRVAHTHRPPLAAAVQRRARRLYSRPAGPLALCRCGCGAPESYLGSGWAQMHRGKQAYAVDPESSCWIWQLTVDEGRPLVRLEGRLVKAYRLFYERAHGPIPDGRAVRRTCGQGLCVNPAHLELGAAAPSVDFVVDEETGCWVWQRGFSEGGYGVLFPRIDGVKRQVRAHRRVYEEHVGPIPDGHDLHHVCENPACVNPDHLEPLTPEAHRRRHGKAG